MRNHSLLKFVAAALLAVAAAAASDDTFPRVARVVAIGDVHGDFEAFTGLLRAGGLISGSGKWVGGKTHLVQIGDVVDRGPDSRRCLDLLMALQKQARQAGGRVHALIGNHEAMNAYGDFRYVSAADYAGFRRDSSERVRTAYFERHAKGLKAAGMPEPDEEYRRKWLASHPLGFFERSAAMSVEGLYGRWVLSNPVAVKINSLVFIHAGISPKYAGLSLKDLNRIVVQELASPARLEGGVTMDPEGPLWYRGLAQGDEAALEGHLTATLERLGADGMVVGHTVTEGFITPRFGGRVLLIDTGISQVYGARAACLVVEGTSIYALQGGRKVKIPSIRGRK